MADAGHVAALVLGLLALVALALKIMFQWATLDSSGATVYAVAPDMPDRSVANTTLNIAVPLMTVLAVIVCAGTCMTTGQ